MAPNAAPGLPPPRRRRCKRAHCVKCNAATLEKCLQCKEGYKPNANGVCKPYCVEGKDGCAKCTTQG